MTDLRVEAQQLVDRGWKVIRLEPGSKKPVESGWPDRDARATDFQPGENIGVKFGPASGGLTDIDLDYEFARKLIGCSVFGLNHLVEFGRSSQRPGERGHRLVVCPDSPDRHRPLGIRGKVASAAMKARGLGLTVLEVRGSHSSQTALPPSVAKGDPLVWTVPGSEPPTMSWTDLNRRVELLAVAALGAALYPDDEREAFCDLLIGALGDAGTEANLMVAEVAILRRDDENALRSLDVAPAGGLHEFFDHVGLPEVEAPVRRWLGQDATSAEQSAEAVRDAPGAYTAEQLQQMLAPLDPEDYADYYSWRDLMFAAHHATGGSSAGREVFVAWSARNPAFGPGKRSEAGKLWADEVRGAWKRTRLDHGGTSITVGTILHELIEHGHRDVAAEFIRHEDFEGDEVAEEEPLGGHAAEITDVRAEKKAEFNAHVERYRPRQVADLLQMPRPKWAIDRWLLQGSLAAIVGGEKTFKTFSMIDIACRVALGLDWHGVKTVQGNVLYIIAEGNEREFADRIYAWCLKYSFDPEDLRDRLTIIPVRVGLDNAEDMKAFFAAVSGDVALTVVDTLAQNMDGAENDTRDMNLFVRGANEIRFRLKCAVVIVHHTGKDPTKIYRGNSALVGAVDSMWVTLRDDDESEDLVLQRYRSRFAPQGVKRVMKAERITTQEATEDDDYVETLVMTFVREGTKDDGIKKVTVPTLQWHRAIIVIAEQPGAVVADRATVGKALGIKNTGSTSKLFTKLKDDGLITGTGPFTLTEKGLIMAVQMGAQLAEVGGDSE